MAKNKVKFGLAEVHFFPIESTNEFGKPTYGAAIPVPGAVKLSMAPEGESEPFYADDMVYFLVSSNNGYSGQLEIALIPDEVRELIMGAEKDSKGVYIEKNDAKQKEFAMTARFQGDRKNTRFVFYRCSLARPELSGETVGKSISPETETCDLTAMPRGDNGVVRAYCYEGDAPYEAWHTAPYEITAPGVGG